LYELEKKWRSTATARLVIPSERVNIKASQWATSEETPPGYDDTSHHSPVAIIAHYK
jgi:hypothetical protein